MKKIVLSITACILAVSALVAQQTSLVTTLVPTTEKFKNGELVYQVNHYGAPIGQFWPVNGINLVTRQTDPILFTKNLDSLQLMLRGVATAPDGMTSGSHGSYTMEGRSLSWGRPCGDGLEKDYGIVIVDKGFHISFTHKREHSNMDSLYWAVQARSGTLFYLPSIYRNGAHVSSQKMLDKVIVCRNAQGRQQVAVIIFNQLVTYDQARTIVLGLDRAPTKTSSGSTTTHIYMLDGGSNWGQACKEVNGKSELVGTRNPNVVTNYLVFY